MGRFYNRAGRSWSVTVSGVGFVTRPLGGPWQRRRRPPAEAP
jgi:hypothetical protein